MTPARQILDWLGPMDRLACGAAALVMAGWGLTVTGAPVITALPLAGLGAAALAVQRIDARHFLIPDLLTLAVGGLGLVDAALRGDALGPRLAAMAALGAALWLLRAGFTAWKGQTALGLGDVKFLAAAAAWIALESLPIYLFLAAFSGLVEALLRRPAGGRIAFGAHLAPWLCAMVLARPWLG